MLKYNNYCIYIIAVLLLGNASIHAQEKLTDFRGSPCCYEFEKIIPADGDFNYGIATDHQDGVRIYLLEELKANLVFSNDQDDKITLIDHGLLEDFYYFVHQDRIELFRFSDGNIETYEFNDPLPYNRSQKEAISMGNYGLTLIPESETEALQFYNLASQRFETRSASLNRDYDRIQLDSFILFSTFEDEQGKLFSHNIVSDKIHIIHSRDSSRIDLFYENSIVFFGDQKNFYITNGRLDNTYFLDKYYSFRRKDILSHQKKNVTHLLLDINWSEEPKYIELNWRTGIVEDYRFPKNQVLNFINDFYRMNENDLLLVKTSDLMKINIRNDSISTIIQPDRRQAAELDTANAYFSDGGRLNSINYATEEITEVSDIRLFQPDRYVREIHKVNDSLFYFIGFNDSHEETNIGLFYLDVSRDTILDLLSLGKYGQGLTETKLQKVGSKLLLRNENQIFKWTGQQFEYILTSDFHLPILQHKDNYYFMEYTGNTSITLYEWQNQSQIITAVEDVPFNDRRGVIYNDSDQLIFTSTFNGAFEVDFDSGTFDTLSPYEHSINIHKAWQVGDYIIMYTEDPGIRYEYWSYHILSRSWTKIQTSEIEIDDHIKENPKHVGNYLLQEKYDYPGRKMTSISMHTGEEKVLLDKNNLGPHYWYYFEYISCAGLGLINAGDTENGDKKLFITDGTPDGTRQILDLNPVDYYSRFYNFEGNQYFTAFYEDKTKAYRLNCETEQLEMLDGLDPLIPRQHFKLGNQTYTLGYQLFPEQNLSFNRVIDNQAQVLSVSPYEKVFNSFSFFWDPSFRPNMNLSDSLLSISVSLDEKGEELWYIRPDSQIERMTDLNEGPFDSEISNLTAFDEYLYFTGYKYGSGKQVWRLPLPNLLQNKHHEKLELVIAPNPADGVLTINNLPTEKGEVRIFDISGKSAFNGFKNKGAIQFSHNMQHYPPGMYIVQLRVNNELYSGKFILK